MTPIVFTFLPVLILIGLLTSYTDVKKGKIRNKHVLGGLILSILAHISLVYISVLNVTAALLSAAYFILAVIGGFLLWYFGIWSAGDAKLYACFIALIPAVTYQNPISEMPLITLMINTFIPISTFFVIKLIITTTKKQKINAVRKILNLKMMGLSLLTVFVLAQTITLLTSLIGIQIGYFTRLMSILAVSSLIRHLLKSKTNIFFVITGGTLFLLNIKIIISTTYLIHFVGLAGGYIIVKHTIGDLADIFSKEVKVKQLKEGMIISDHITKKGYRIRMNKEINMKQVIDKDYFYTPSPDGIKNKEIWEIQRAHHKGKIHFDKLTIQQKLPLAPFLFAGAIITIIINNNLISALSVLIP